MDNKQELERKIAGIKVDYDFYSTGFDFTEIEPKSANHLFGNGKWKKQCIETFGEEIFQKHCDKYGNKPIDFKIVSLKTKKAPFFAFNELIKVFDNNNTYSGEYKILGVEKDKIFLMIPFLGNSTGKIINISRKNGAEKALKKNMDLLNSSNEIKPKYSNMETTKEPEQAGAKFEIKEFGFWTANNGRNKKIAIAIGVIILIISSFIIYKKYKQKK